MSHDKNTSLLALFTLNTIYLLVLNQLAAAESSDSLNPAPSLSPAVFEPAMSSLFSTSLMSSFPEDVEISDYCKGILGLFKKQYVTYVECLVQASRPVTVCQSCSLSFSRFQDSYKNISDQMGPGNESCRDSLLRSDRLMLVYQLYSNLQYLWTSSNCEKCIDNSSQSLTNVTLTFMRTLNQTLTCFEKYQLGNHTELCKSCKKTYGDVNELYDRIEKNDTMCIDIEDAMNMTRRLWSKNFNCSLPRDETVPVIAVSCFMLFLPIIFYLSSFLHSEQKKRKLIHPNRAKSYASLMNIQDKQS